VSDVGHRGTGLREEGRPGRAGFLHHTLEELTCSAMGLKENFQQGKVMAETEQVNPRQRVTEGHTGACLSQGVGVYNSASTFGPSKD
jgi:hypothetical protein